MEQFQLTVRSDLPKESAHHASQLVGVIFMALKTQVKQSLEILSANSLSAGNRSGKYG